MLTLKEFIELLTKEQATSAVPIKFAVGEDSVTISEILESGESIDHVVIIKEGILTDEDGFEITDAKKFLEWFVYTFYTL